MPEQLSKWQRDFLAGVPCFPTGRLLLPTQVIDAGSKKGWWVPQHEFWRFVNENPVANPSEPDTPVDPGEPPVP